VRRPGKAGGGLRHLGGCPKCAVAAAGPNRCNFDPGAVDVGWHSRRGCGQSPGVRIRVDVAEGRALHAGSPAGRRTTCTQHERRGRGSPASRTCQNFKRAGVRVPGPAGQQGRPKPSAGHSRRGAQRAVNRRGRIRRVRQEGRDRRCLSPGSSQARAARPIGAVVARHASTRRPRARREGADRRRGEKSPETACTTTGRPHG